MSLIDQLAKVKPYLKAVVAVVGAIVGAAITQFPGQPTLQHWGPIVVSVLTAIGVYVVPNLPDEPQPVAPSKMGG